jgi:hypothetical protein
MKQLNQNFFKAISIPIQIIPTTGSLNGAAVDTKVSEMERYDTALALIEIGDITGTPTSVKVKVQESDSSTFASGVTTAAGGDEITVTADHSYTMEIERTKRYLRVVVTTAGGTTPTVECFGTFILWNAVRPFPRLSAADITP